MVLVTSRRPTAEMYGEYTVLAPMSSPTLGTGNVDKVDFKESKVDRSAPGNNRSQIGIQPQHLGSQREELDTRVDFTQNMSGIVHGRRR